MKGATAPLLEHRQFEVISIHAPVKGATLGQYREQAVFDISIHAPVKGATLYSLISMNTDRNFNPRSREGSDVLLSPFPTVQRISIHAPVKGATVQVG